MDRGMLNVAADQLPKEIETHFKGMEPEIGVVGTLAEVTFTEEDGERTTAVLMWCSDERPWVQLGFLNAARMSVEGR